MLVYLSLSFYLVYLYPIASTGLCQLKEKIIFFTFSLDYSLSMLIIKDAENKTTIQREETPL
uniref:Uncharacterized protein n=1 Tax=Siphoviridae sp. ctZHD14 TaxID=2827891 RepID=A0A8S5SXH1_9CAUD|nr:MAG TPA: hypothetical protein [Siphoviridae sp. ctZHD14]